MPTPAPTISSFPTPAPSPKPQTDLPTAPRPTDSPIAKDDIRNFFFCGIDWCVLPRVRVSRHSFDKLKLKPALHLLAYYTNLRH